jgi:putative addiction module component (TIGR02574 family)
MSFDELLSAANGLPAAERMRLSDLLRESVPPDEWPPLSDEWLAEIDRRSCEYDAGRMPTASWSEVRQRTRRQAGLDG